METEDGTVEEEDDDEDEEMTRDEFNLNKMIVIVTSAPQISLLIAHLQLHRTRLFGNTEYF
jgi:hypothetical protein